MQISIYIYIHTCIYFIYLGLAAPVLIQAFHVPHLEWLPVSLADETLGISDAAAGQLCRELVSQPVFEELPLRVAVKDHDDPSAGRGGAGGRGGARRARGV